MAPPAVGRCGRGPALQPGLPEPVAGGAVHPPTAAVEQLQPQQESIGECTPTRSVSLPGGRRLDRRCRFRRRRFTTSGR